MTIDIAKTKSEYRIAVKLCDQAEYMARHSDGKEKREWTRIARLWDAKAVVAMKELDYVHIEAPRV